MVGDVSICQLLSSETSLCFSLGLAKEVSYSDVALHTSCYTCHVLLHKHFAPVKNLLHLPVYNVKSVSKVEVERSLEKGETEDACRYMTFILGL